MSSAAEVRKRVDKLFRLLLISRQRKIGTEAVLVFKKIGFTLALLTLLALMPVRASTELVLQPVVRVQITRFRTSNVSITASVGSVCVIGASASLTGEKFDFAVEGSQVVLKDASGRRQVLGQAARISGADVITVRSADGTSASYKGSLEIRAANGRFVLINEVGLEDYVAGVVCAEMPNSYPFEALKAQAVAARTYALRNKNKHASTGCDLCDTSHCQTYLGIAPTKARCRAAVAETAGLILTYRDEPAHVFYSADAGGWTRNYAETYPKVDAPYLCGVKDPDGVPHTTWKLTYPLADLARKLTKAGIKEAEGLESVRTAQISSDGRVVSVEITGSRGTTRIAANKLREILGMDQLRSCLFVIGSSDTDGVIVFEGKGYGHGIGLCQMGAKGLAQKPFNYSWDRILAHYFPGTQIKDLTEARLATVQSKTGQAAHSPLPTPNTPLTNTLTNTLRLNLRLVEPDEL